MKKLILFALLLFVGFGLKAQYTLNSQFGNLADCDTMTRGIYVVWWDNDWNYAADADVLLDTMISIRNNCLNDLGMQDPPNPPAGYYYNVYLHHGQDLFPSGWGNGQGTDSNGFPYLTLPIGAHNDYVNVCHETFHVFQYSSNSPGFAYAGPSQWYIEASANWYAAIKNKNFDGAFLEAESLVRLPHVPMWLSFNNFPSNYPQNWQRYVHQYAMALFLYYLTEEVGVAESFISSGFYGGIQVTPQEYIYNTFGAPAFRNQFLNWAAHMTNHFDFLTPGQITVLENEFDTYADPADDNEFTETYNDVGSGGWYRPVDSLITTAWSFNTYKVNNTSSDTYGFQYRGDVLGSLGDSAYFRGIVVVKNSVTGTRYAGMTILSDIEGSTTVTVTPDDTELCFIIASMPETFSGVSQKFRYDMLIEKGVTSLQPGLTTPVFETARTNLLGQPVGPKHHGLQVVRYSDGTSKKVLNLR